MNTSRFAALITLCITIAASIYFTLQPMHYRETTPSIVRVGILPDMSEENIRQRYDPLLDYLSEETGLEFRLVLPSDYDELVQLFGEHELDLAYFGGLTYVQAHANYQAEPLVMRDVDTRFTSLFLVSQDNQAHDLADFKGKVFSFGSRLSTSGHLMPRHFMLTEEQIIPEEFFSTVRYSGAHDKTAYLVRDGEVDLGVANSEIIMSMFREGRLKENDLRVLSETPPYPDYVWVVHDDLDEDIKTQLRDAFLGLDTDDADHTRLLAGMGAKTFLPAGHREFLPLTRIAHDLGMLGTERR
jgi:phosphonate transport system substrate-binding protein